ncbi:hypothetical protein PF005_g5861 [Phytophthora fragariae]|nr:hypothetical protein PF003_g5210 [Phytophthora fragariae]KAE8946633.1 hypothetical protein PF009_g3753 [Phytophthora fragariae]KAE9021669.1 hypothetical protein PF011_g4840 [Phytophthora fragariae]KAE9125690.1 hypothetical protein PF007_g6267 [Phytophthora fragariae]KAE9126962.1 hypothetical protein PF010_g5099 [Phytophthora fragariae]
MGSDKLRRSSAAILWKISMNVVDESHVVPLYDVDVTRVVNVTIEHIVNFVFYREGIRRIPQGVVVAAALIVPADEVTADDQSPTGGSRAEPERLDQLYDFNDGLEPAETEQVMTPQIVNEKRKRQEAPRPVQDAGDAR